MPARYAGFSSRREKRKGEFAVGTSMISMYGELVSNAKYILSEAPRSKPSVDFVDASVQSACHLQNEHGDGCRRVCHSPIRVTIYSTHTTTVLSK